MPLFLTRK